MIRPSIMIPWRIAQARKAAMEPICIWLSSIGEFWKTWAEVYREPK